MAKKPERHLQRLRVGQAQHQLEMHSVALAATKKTLSLKDLYGKFIGALGLDDVDLDWPISKILRGGPGGLMALAVKIMRSEQFKPDGLTLDKADVLGCKTVGDLEKLILHWYEANGWVVD